MMSTDASSSASDCSSSSSTFDQSTNDRSLSSLSPSPPSGGNSTGSSLVTLTAIFIASFLLLTGPSTQFGLQPRLITRFCYNSPNLSTINSQCVLCNYYTFDATLLGCTGSTALSVNITASQAFCVISQCLGQVRQSPVFLGRRKREVGEKEHQQHLENNDDDHGG
ncbi:hypothetical protein TYRP_008859 [Tyrophagus putrescentiae]|nr:hypothetical protein TYRP_008859 [Tyrophagus putrescentiae]